MHNDCNIECLIRLWCISLSIDELSDTRSHDCNIECLIRLWCISLSIDELSDTRSHDCNEI
jgi:hypothetical protein